MFELSSGDYHSIDLVLFLLSGDLRVKADPCCHWSVGQQPLEQVTPVITSSNPPF